MIFMYIKGKLVTKIKAGQRSFQAFALFIIHTQKTLF